MSQFKFLVDERGKKMLLVKDAQFVFRTNFGGNVTDFNDKGNRLFNLQLDVETAEKLRSEGWKVKTYIPKNSDEAVLYTEIKVNYKEDAWKNPVIEVRADGGDDYVEYDVDMLGKLDGYRFEKVDLTIVPYNWTMRGQTGVKGYLNTMKAIIQKNSFADDMDDFFGASDTPF